VKRWGTILAPLLLLAGGFVVSAQQPGLLPPSRPPMDPLLQLMITQPSIDVTSNLVATAVFDPPVINPGGKSVYRFTVNALNDSVEWAEPAFPTELRARFTARGQNLSMMPGEAKLKPLTGINYHIAAEVEGVFSVPAFSISVYGRTVQVPEAQLQVAAVGPAQSPQFLTLDVDATNCYVGQPVKVRVLLTASAANLVQTAQEVKLNGDGFLVDLANARQSISGVPGNGSPTAYVYETSLSPLRSGELTVSAQGFTGGNLFGGAIVIRGQVTIPGGPPQFKFLDSEPLTLRVQPLPKPELPGFTGAIGSFRTGPPQLSTNRIAVGGILKLSVAFAGDGSLTRLVPPPPPLSTNWQVFEAERGGPTVLHGNPLVLPGAAVAFTYTLVALTTNVSETPPIPFSFFDAETGTYVDATIPPVPILVIPGERPADPAALAVLMKEPEREEKPQLSAIATVPGRTVSSLEPLQHRPWFILLQIAPLAAFIALWQWDRRRRYYEQYPDVLVRLRARRALKRARRAVERARASGDAERYLHEAIRAIQVAAAPQHVAEPRALVARDVVQALEGDSGSREFVQQLFSAADAFHFSPAPQVEKNPAQWHPKLERILNDLEARL